MDREWCERGQYFGRDSIDTWVIHSAGQWSQSKLGERDGHKRGRHHKVGVRNGHDRFRGHGHGLAHRHNDKRRGLLSIYGLSDQRSQQRDDVHGGQLGRERRPWRQFDDRNDNPNRQYCAPQTIGSQQTFVVKAILQADSNSFGTANATVVPANAPNLSTINPTKVPQGSPFEDIYLTGSNFVSTDKVRANGTPVATNFISTGVLLARIPETNLTS